MYELELKDFFRSEKIDFCLPEVFIMGNKCIILSGHQGISELSDVQIKLKTKCGYIVISGKHLRVYDVYAKDIRILGEISGVNYV